METIDISRSQQARKHFARKEKVRGQFFTPPEVADFIVSFAGKYVASGGKIACDPACGDGSFLLSLLKYGFQPLGVDIDEEVIKFLPQKIKGFVIQGDGLLLEEDGKFDLVVGNPPFSAKYGRVKGEILKKFELCKGPSQAIEILFLEKFIKLCKDGGVIGIILPHGIFSDIRLSYVREYITSNLTLIAVISLPRNIFKARENKTSSKTCILIAKKEKKLHSKEVIFASVDSLNELLTKDIKKMIVAEPQQFLYPEFYLDRNPILEKLPKLRDFKIEIIQGSAIYGEGRKFSSCGIPFISARVVTPYGIDFSKDNKFVESGSLMDKKRAYLEIGDVVFVRVGVGCIGRTAVVTKECEKGIADDWIYIIRNKDSRLSPYYIALWFQTPLIQKEIRRLARGVGTITIPISLVRELPILPCEENVKKKCEEKYKEIIFGRENNDLPKARKIREEILKELEETCLKQLNLIK
jgi:type I restriction enzyme M protein